MSYLKFALIENIATMFFTAVSIIGLYYVTNSLLSLLCIVFLLNLNIPKESETKADN